MTDAHPLASQEAARLRIKREEALNAALEEANRRYANMTPEQRLAMWVAQRKSWARQDLD